jgi:hypothetical protein
MSASEPAARAARATDDPRYCGHPLAGALAFRRSVAALARLLPLVQGFAALNPGYKLTFSTRCPFCGLLKQNRTIFIL